MVSDFLLKYCDSFFRMLYRPFKSGAHSRFLSTQNPVDRWIHQIWAKSKKIFCSIHPCSGGEELLYQKKSREGLSQPANADRPELATSLESSLERAGLLAGWLADWLAGELGLASLKNLAIFSDFRWLFAPFIYKFLNDFRKWSNYCLDGNQLFSNH